MNFKRLPAFLALGLVLSSPALKAAEQQTTSGYKEVQTLALRQPFNTKSDWHLTAYETSEEEQQDPFCKHPVKISLWTDKAKKDEHTTQLISAYEYDTSITYPLQRLLSLKIVKIDKTQKGVWISAEYCGGGSFTLVRNEIWTYDRKSDSFEPELRWQNGELGESKVISSGPLAGCLISVDPEMLPGEIHFDPHHYVIDVYKYSPKQYGFQKILSFVTSKKYESENETAVHVIDPELQNINKKLIAVYGPTGSPL